jgi:hypothetical protein
MNKINYYGLKFTFSFEDSKSVIYSYSQFRFDNVLQRVVLLIILRIYSISLLLIYFVI